MQDALLDSTWSPKPNLSCLLWARPGSWALGLCSPNQGPWGHSYGLSLMEKCLHLNVKQNSELIKLLRRRELVHVKHTGWKLENCFWMSCSLWWEMVDVFFGTVLLSKSLVVNLYYFYNQQKYLIINGLKVSLWMSPSWGNIPVPLYPRWSLRLCLLQPHTCAYPTGGLAPLCSLPKFPTCNPRLWAPWGQKPGLICLVFPLPSTRLTRVTTQYMFVF